MKLLMLTKRNVNLFLPVIYLLVLFQTFTSNIRGGAGGPYPALFDSGCNVNGLVMYRNFATKFQFKVKSYAKNKFKPPVTLADGSITGKIDQVLFLVDNNIWMSQFFADYWLFEF